MRRLLPRERSFWGFAELWADDQQFISVHSRRAQEHYQRFRFEDVQAIAVTELPHWTIWQILWLLAGLMILVAPWRLWTLGGVWGPAVLSCFTIWPLAFAVREVARGPRCRVVFHTAGGAQPIRAVARMRRVPEFLSVVTPLVEGAQGQLENLEVTARPPADPQERLARMDGELSGLRVTTYAVLLLSALMEGASAVWPKRATELLGLSVMAGVAEWVMAAALWRSTSPLLRPTPGGFVALVLLTCLLAEICIELMVFWIRFPPNRGTQDPQDPVQTAVEVGWRVAVAAAGMWLLMRRRRRSLAE